jgi:hypothetical protein
MEIEWIEIDRAHGLSAPAHLARANKLLAARRLARGRGGSPATGDHPGREEVHRRANGGRAITPAQPIDPKHRVVKRFDAKASQFQRHTSAHEAALLQILDILEGEAALPIMLARPSREVGGMLLSEFDKTRTRWRIGL